MANDILSEKIIQDFSKSFAKYVNIICAARKIPIDSIYISTLEITAALKEANRDLAMIRHRRGSPTTFKGISIGKISGAVCFRLNRYRIVNIGEPDLYTDGTKIPLLEKRYLYKIQDLATIMLIFEMILKHKPKPGAQKELIYIFSRRHMNQEMLGVVFDSIINN